MLNWERLKKKEKEEEASAGEIQQHPLITPYQCDK